MKQSPGQHKRFEVVNRSDQPNRAHYRLTTVLPGEKVGVIKIGLGAG